MRMDADGMGGGFFYGSFAGFDLGFCVLAYWLFSSDGGGGEPAAGW